MRYIIGIDEAGRGPLAGPVAVGVVSVPHNFDALLVEGAKDSKQMTEKARERVYARMCTLRDRGVIGFAVGFSTAGVIDREGIVPAVAHAMDTALDVLDLDPAQCDVRLDGGLRAPERFVYQQTIIRGDATELAISLASIAAKVERDAIMRGIATQFPAYGLDIHKGYGTAQHRTAIRMYGLCAEHRATFCTRIYPHT